MNRQPLISLILLAVFSFFPGSSDLHAAHPFGNILASHLFFMENIGQLPDQSVQYWTPTSTGAMLISTTGELIYSLRDPMAENSPLGWVIQESFATPGKSPFHGLDHLPSPRIIADNGASGTPKAIGHFRKITSNNLYPGIHLTLKKVNDTVEKLFIITPAGDPGSITGTFAGAAKTAIADDGSLILQTDLGDVRFSRPLAFQEIAGERIPVAVSYTLQGVNGYGFTVGSYNKNHDLIIDPVLASSFISSIVFSGPAQPDIRIAEDNMGNVFISGSTPAGFPTTPGTYSADFHGGDMDLFVIKMDGDFTTMLAATFVGGSGNDVLQAATMHDQTLFLSGWTTSRDFPIPPTGYDSSFNGIQDAFIITMDTDLKTLTSGTFLGGSSEEGRVVMAVDKTGAVFISGTTRSENFPVTDATAVPQNEPQMYLSILSADLQTLKASTIYGGKGLEQSRGIALDNSHIFIAGTTRHGNLPGCSGIGEIYSGGGSDGFIVRYPLDLAMPQAMYFGGMGDDEITGIILVNDSIYVVGGTGSPDFKTTAGAYSTVYHGGTESDNDNTGLAMSECFVARIAKDFSTLQASTFLGGSANEFPFAITRDGKDNIIIAGLVESEDFPMTDNSFKSAPIQLPESFIASLSPDLQILLHATFIGGKGKMDQISDLLVSDGDLLFSGITMSEDFPVSEKSFLKTFSSGSMAFISRIDTELSEFIRPGISVTPEALDFDLVFLPESSSRLVTVTNSGSHPLRFHDISVTGEDAADFIPVNGNGNCRRDVDLSPDQACTIQITFKALTGGKKAAELVIKSTAAAMEEKKISLQGNAVVMPLHVN